MAVLGVLTVELRARAQKFIAGMKGSAAHARSASEEMKRVSMAAAKVGAALGVVGGVTAKITADFEKSMVRAAAVAGKGAKGFDKSFKSMESSALSLSKTTEFTAQQVAEGMTFMAMAGSDAETTIASMPAVLQLASAASMDLGRSADIVTNVMKGFDLSAADLSKTNNILVGTFTNSNTSLEQLGRSFRKAGPTAKALGISMEDTAAIIGTMGNAGFQAEEAGTALRNVMVRLVKATPKASKAMDRLNISTKSLGEKGLLGTIAALKDSKGAFDDAGKSAEFTADLMDVFGLRAGPVLQAALNQSTASVMKLRTAIDGAVKNNTAAFIEKKQLETLTGQFNILRSNVEAAAISFGAALVPILHDVVGLLQKVFAAMANLSPGFKSFVASSGAAAFALSSFIAVALGLLAIIPSVIAGVSALNVALIPAGLTLTGVLLPAIAAVAVVVGSFLIALNLLEESIGKDISLFDTFADIFQTIGERADGVATIMRSVAGAVLLTIQQLSPLVLIDVAGWFGGWADGASDVAHEMENLSDNQRDLASNDKAIRKLADEMQGLNLVMDRRKSLGRVGDFEVGPVEMPTGRSDQAVEKAKELNREMRKLFKERNAFMATEQRRQKALKKEKKELTDIQKKVIEDKKKETAEALKQAGIAAKAKADEKTRLAIQKRRNKALAQARIMMEKTIHLEGSTGAEKELFDLGALKSEFPELGKIIGERAKQIIEGVKLDDLAGALEEAVEAGVLGHDAAKVFTDKRTPEDLNTSKFSGDIEELIRKFAEQPSSFEEPEEQGVFLAEAFKKVRGEALQFGAGLLKKLASGDIMGAMGDLGEVFVKPLAGALGSAISKTFKVSDDVAAAVGIKGAGFVLSALKTAADMIVKVVKQLFANVGAAIQSISSDVGANKGLVPLQKGMTSLKGAFSALSIGVISLLGSMVAVAAFPITIPLAVLGAALTALAGVVTVATGGLPLLIAGFAFLTGFAFSMAKETETGAKLQGAFNNAMAQASAPLEPFARKLFALVPVFNFLMTGLSTLANQFLGPLPRILFEAFRLIALAVLHGAWALEGLRIEFNEAGGRIQAVFMGIELEFAKFGLGLAQLSLWLQQATRQDTTFQEGVVAEKAGVVADLEADLTNFTSTFDDVSQTFRDLDLIIGDLTRLAFPAAIDAGLEFADAADEASNAFSSAMTNVPQGFKVELERFKQMTPGLGSAPVPGETTSGNSAINIDTVNVFTDDVNQFAADLQEQALEQTGGIGGAQFESGGGF